MPLSLGCWLAVRLFCMWQAELPTEVPRQNPYTSAADLQHGKRLFAANCAVCHGPEGAGGRGANLARPKLPRAPDDRALFLVIRQGVPGTEMPPAWLVLDEHEIWQVAGYVRSLGRVAVDLVPGDARTGANLFQAEGCVDAIRWEAKGGR